MSLYFQKGIAFSLWNGCVQFGDFLSIFLSFLFVQAIEVNAGVFLFFMATVTFILGLLVKKMLAEVSEK
jgi:sugar phosphate permease